MMKPSHTRVNKRPKFAVIGGGILGTLCALNISRLGYKCDIIDRRTELWNGATFAGEGKIHLGYVYGKANSVTLISLLQTAHSFTEDFEYAVNRRLDWSSIVSVPFEYGIPDSSLITPGEFEEHAEHLWQLARDVTNARHFSYLGRHLQSIDFCVKKDEHRRTFSTPELSIAVPQLRNVVLSAIRDSGHVQHIPNTTVSDVIHTDDHIVLMCEHHDPLNNTFREYDYVINCAWENSAYLDALGTNTTPKPLNLRSRMFLHAQTSESPRALTLTLGPFGDFISFTDGRVYASWYPSGLNGFTESLRVPRHWSNFEQPTHFDAFVGDVIEELSPWIPQVSKISNISVYSRIVVAEGNTDIDDPDSELHQRGGSTVSIDRRWISVTSFKLTTAPAAARHLGHAVQRLSV